MQIKYGFRLQNADVQTLQNEVGPGWKNLIGSLVEDLEKLGWNGEVTQIKEKFGGLRFYVNEGSLEVFDRISLAEDASLKICEDCGNSGYRRVMQPPLRTLCDECAKRYIAAFTARTALLQ